MKKQMFYSLLLIMIAWSCMNHAKEVESLSKIDQELSQKIANLKIAVRQKNNTNPVVQKGNIKSAFDDAIHQLAVNGKQDDMCMLKRELPLQAAVDIVQSSENMQKPQPNVSLSKDISKEAAAAMCDVEELDDSDIEDAPVTQTRKVNLGGRCNAFYLDNCDEPKRFAIIASVYDTFCLGRAFNSCKQSVPMAQFVFGAPSFTIADIFLLSRLSADGNLYSAGTSSTQGLGTQTEPGAQMGNQTDWQYLNLVSTTQVSFDAHASEFGADASFVYRFNFGKCIDVACSVGFNVPVICRTHELDLRLVNAVLYKQIPYAAGDTTVREDTIRLFFNSFVSIEDFFYRAVLLPKGLKLDRKQQAIGFGDVSLFSTFDFAPSLDWVDGLQVGFNLSLPSASKPSGNKVWEIQLGTGAVQLDLFGNVIFNGGNKFFNPTIYIAGEFGFPFTGNMRVPKTVSFVSHSSASDPNDPADRVTVQVSSSPDTFAPNIPGLIVPGAPPMPDVPLVFANYYTTSFSEVDSTVRFFADSVSQARIKQGAKVIVGFGNYFYATRDCQMRLGVFYDFTAKGADKICVFNCGGTPTKFDTSLFDCMSEYAQRISWHAAYKLGTCGEFMVGSQHVVAGKNVFKTNQAFATFVATF